MRLPARFQFEVVNLPLRGDLLCGDFVVRSTVAFDEVDARLREMDAEWEVTASGEYRVPEGVPDQPGYPYFAQETYLKFARQAEVLDLLLSFANRSHVQIINPVLQVQRDEEWIHVGGHSFYPVWEGSARRFPWYASQVDLQAFLDRAYPPMTTTYDELRGGESRTGLRLALHALDASRAGDSGEQLYLRAWAAFEILVERQTQEWIMPDDEFRPLCREVERTIRRELPGNEHRARRAAVYEKLQELNRRGIVTAAQEFLAQVLPAEQYPQHQVMTPELRLFSRMRNDIAHTGIVQWETVERGAAALGEEVTPEVKLEYIHSKHMQLTGLTEKIVFALLGWTNYPMDVPWRHWLVG